MLPSNRIHSSADAYRLVRRRLPWMEFDDMNDAAGKENGVALNREAMQDIRLRSRVLVDVI